MLTISPDGQRLRLDPTAEKDLLISQALRLGAFDDLGPPQPAARRPHRPQPSSNTPAPAGRRDQGVPDP